MITLRVFIEDLKRIRSFNGGKITLVDVNQASQIGQMVKQNGHETSEMPINKGFGRNVKQFVAINVCRLSK